MNNTELLIISKISELNDVIEEVGKYYNASGDRNTLDFVYRRIEARNRLELYLKRI